MLPGDYLLRAFAEAYIILYTRQHDGFVPSSFVSFSVEGFFQHFILFTGFPHQSPRASSDNFRVLRLLPQSHLAAQGILKAMVRFPKNERSEAWGHCWS